MSTIHNERLKVYLPKGSYILLPEEGSVAKVYVYFGTLLKIIFLHTPGAFLIDISGGSVDRYLGPNLSKKGDTVFKFSLNNLE